MRMLRAARPDGVAVVGGNLARGDRIAITVTLLGSLPQGEPVLRTGARPGDRIYVTGQPGLAHLGLELLARGDRDPEDLWRPPAPRPPAWRTGLGRTHPGSRAALQRFLVPEARLAVARDLAQHRPTAMIDVSDGLATDLHRLAGSGLRFVIDTESIPRSRGFIRLAEAMEADPISVSLGGGEDYELLLCLPPSAALRVGPRVVVAGIPLTRIGEVEPGEGVVCRDERGREAPLVASGFRHFAPD
jgi:thiamine-monophosphate kinase